MCSALNVIITCLSAGDPILSVRPYQAHEFAYLRRQPSGSLHFTRQLPTRTPRKNTVSKSWKALITRSGPQFTIFKAFLKRLMASTSFDGGLLPDRLCRSNRCVDIILMRMVLLAFLLLTFGEEDEGLEAQNLLTYLTEIMVERRYVQT